MPIGRHMIIEANRPHFDKILVTHSNQEHCRTKKRDTVRVGFLADQGIYVPKLAGALADLQEKAPPYWIRATLDDLLEQLVCIKVEERSL